MQDTSIFTGCSFKLHLVSFKAHIIHFYLFIIPSYFCMPSIQLLSNRFPNDITWKNGIDLTQSYNLSFISASSWTKGSRQMCRGRQCLKVCDTLIVRDTNWLCSGNASLDIHSAGWCLTGPTWCRFTEASTGIQKALLSLAKTTKSQIQLMKSWCLRNKCFRFIDIIGGGAEAAAFSSQHRGPTLAESFCPLEFIL